MGLFDFFKKQKVAPAPSGKLNYFAFSLVDLNEDVVSKMPRGLFKGESVDVTVQIVSGVLVCMYKGTQIGHANQRSQNVYNSYANLNPILHSRSITGGVDGKPYRLKLRFKFYE